MQTWADYENCIHFALIMVFILNWANPLSHTNTCTHGFFVFHHIDGRKVFHVLGKTAFFQLRCIQAQKHHLALLLTKHYLVWLVKCWAKYQPLHCCSKNKDPFERKQTFVSVWLFPWRLGSSIIVFRTQTETDQTHRQPTDQNGSCGRGIHHALIWFGFGLVCTD